MRYFIHHQWHNIVRRLINGDLSPAAQGASGILQEQVHILYQHAPSLLVGNLLVAALCSLVMHTFSPWWMVISWVLIVYLLTCARFLLVHKYQQDCKLKNISRPTEVWRVLFLLGACCSGFVWGGLVLVAFHPAEPVSVLFVGIILAGMTGGCVASLSAVSWGYACFAVPAILPFAVRCMLENNPVYWVFGACALLLLAINIYYSKVVRAATTSAIQLRFENLQLIEELCAAKNLAEQANRAKTHFVAAVTHDLRQPTHALGLYMGALTRLWKNKATADVTSVFTNMQITIDAMNKLLASLLNLSRLDAGATNVAITLFPLSRIFDCLSAQIVGSVTTQQRLTIFPTMYWIKSDEQLLTQILVNLLTNALRYCPEGRVLLGCRRRGEYIDIQIWDTGIGIAQENLQRIFDEFVRVENSGTPSAQGVGLGLAIVRRGAQLLDHELGVHSALGKGSCFYIRVPLVASTSA